MTREQIDMILHDIEEKDKVATFALTRASAEHDAGNDDRARELIIEHEGAREFRNGLISALAVCGVVAGIDRNTRQWVAVRKQ